MQQEAAIIALHVTAGAQTAVQCARVAEAVAVYGLFCTHHWLRSKYSTLKSTVLKVVPEAVMTAEEVEALSRVGMFVQRGLVTAIFAGLVSSPAVAESNSVRR